MCLSFAFGSPYTKDARHINPESSLIFTSIKFLHTYCKQTHVVHVDQKRANPPLLPIQLTAKQPLYPNDHIKHLTFSSLILVSDKNRREGRYCFTNQRSSPTVESRPKPRQFQLSRFMVPGGAASQPPPICLQWGPLISSLFLLFLQVFHLNQSSLLIAAV